MIRILTDSASDLTPQDAHQPGVHIVPLQVQFEDGTLVRDGAISGNEFYARLRAAQKLPTTSQPAPEAFLQELQAAQAAGDEVVGIFISAKLSGTFQCACLAAAECGYDKIYLVDSETASQGEGILIRHALRLRAQGMPAAAIADELEVLKKRIRIFGVVDSLKHLQKGGRLPKAVALVGGALGIKPVLSVIGGDIKLADKARGRPGAYVALFRQIDSLGGDPAHGYALLYSDDKQVLAPVHHHMHQALLLTGGRIAQLGPTIGTHVGPGCAAVAFVEKEK